MTPAQIFAIIAFAIVGAVLALNAPPQPPVNQLGDALGDWM